MFKLRYAFTLPVLAVMLMGQACPDQDAKVRSVLASMCPAATVAYAHYTAISSIVSEKTRNYVETAKAQADRLCTGAESATTITILAAGSDVYLAVRQALKEARANGGGAVAYQGHITALDDMLEKARRQANAH